MIPSMYVHSYIRSISHQFWRGSFTTTTPMKNDFTLMTTCSISAGKEQYNSMEVDQCKLQQCWLLHILVSCSDSSSNAHSATCPHPKGIGHSPKYNRRFDLSVAQNSEKRPRTPPATHKSRSLEA